MSSSWMQVLLTLGAISHPCFEFFKNWRLSLEHVTSVSFQRSFWVLQELKIASGMSVPAVVSKQPETSPNKTMILSLCEMVDDLKLDKTINKSITLESPIRRFLFSTLRSWWWTGKPGMLQSMGSQRVTHDWVTELNRPDQLQRIHAVLWQPLTSGVQLSL